MTGYTLAAADAGGEPLGERSVPVAPTPDEAAAFGDRCAAAYVVAGGAGGVTLYGRDEGAGAWTVVTADVDPDTAEEMRLWFGATRRTAQDSAAAAREAFVRRRPAEEQFMADLRDQVMGLDAGAVASFTVEGPPPEVVAARASGLLAPITQQLALLGPEGWHGLTAVFSFTVSAERSRVRFRSGNRETDVRLPEDVALLVRRQRHLAAAMPAGPWGRLLLTVTLGTGGGAGISTEYDYGDERFPDGDLLSPADYRADLAAYPRGTVPAWLTAYTAGDTAPGPSSPSREEAAAPHGGPAAPPPPAPAPAQAADGPTPPPGDPRLSPREAQRRAATAERLRAAGAQASLGALRGVHPPELVPGSRLGGCGVVAGLLALVGVVMLATSDALGVVVLAVAATLVVYIVVSGSRNALNAPTGTATFESGVVHIDGAGQTHVFRWPSTSVRQRIVDHRRNGVHTHTTYHYELTACDGAGDATGDTVTLSGLVDSERFGHEVQEGVTRAHLPLTLRTVEDGGTASFGPIELDRRAVTARGRSVPWTDIEEINVARGHVSLRVAGKWFALINTEVSRIPNFFVFHAVAEHLRRSAREG